MLNSKVERFEVWVILAAPYHFLVEHFIINQYNELQKGVCSVAPDEERYRYLLERGIYTFRVAVNGTVRDEFIVVDRSLSFGIGLKETSQTLKIALPELYSSALLTGKRFGSYSSNKNYYADALTINETPKTDSEGTLLSLFFRYPSKEAYEGSSKKGLTWDQFSVLDRQLNLTARVAGSANAVVNKDDGWMSAEVDLKQGLSFMLYQSDEHCRLIPVYSDPNHYLHAFLTLADEPKFGTLRVFSSKDGTFKRDDPEYRLIDLLLDKLHNQDFKKSEQVLRYVLNQDSGPFVKIISCYLYLGSPSWEDSGIDLVIGIITELKAQVVLGFRSDLAALELMLWEKGFKINESVEFSVEDPPVIRRGFEAIVVATRNNPKLLGSFSLNDYIAENLLYDSPYTMFTAPQGLLKTKPKFWFGKGENELKVLEGDQNRRDFENVSVANFMGQQILTVMQRDLNLERTGSSWLLHELNGLLVTNPDLDLESAANELCVPQGTLMRVLEVEKTRINEQLRIRTVRLWLGRAAAFVLVCVVGFFGFDSMMVGSGDGYAGAGIKQVDLGLVQDSTSVAAAVPDTVIPKDTSAIVPVSDLSPVERVRERVASALAESKPRGDILDVSAVVEYSSRDFERAIFRGHRPDTVKNIAQNLVFGELPETDSLKLAYAVIESYVKETKGQNSIKYLKLPEPLMREIYFGAKNGKFASSPYVVALDSFQRKNPDLKLMGGTKAAFDTYKKVGLTVSW